MKNDIKTAMEMAYFPLFTVSEADLKIISLLKRLKYKL
jgi:hypothetical protein